MVCMKCGREAPEGQAFCQECLMEMEKLLSGMPHCLALLHAPLPIHI